MKTNDDFSFTNYATFSVLTGREYCLLNTEAQRKASKWTIGEDDICFITRKHGLIIIEVKGM